MELQPPTVTVGSDFESLEHLKQACHELTILDTFEYNTLKLDKTRYTIACKSEDCQWYLHATPVETTSVFRIRKYMEKHDCFGLNHRGHIQATETFIANKIKEKLKEQPLYCPADVVHDIQCELGIKITYSKAHRAKERAIAEINGTHEEACKALPQYCKDIMDTNPNSTAILECTSGNKFTRIFICYGASAMGFSHCRPVLGLDGTHLKSKYQSILLTATAVNANGSLFSLAFVVINAENDENWLWFLQHLH